MQQLHFKIEKKKCNVENWIHPSTVCSVYNISVNSERITVLHFEMCVCICTYYAPKWKWFKICTIVALFFFTFFFSIFYFILLLSAFINGHKLCHLYMRYIYSLIHNDHSCVLCLKQNDSVNDYIRIEMKEKKNTEKQQQ